MNDSWEKEREYLEKVVSYIEHRSRELAEIPRYYGKDIVEQILDDQRQERLARLRLSSPEPYFGRLDFQEESAESSVPLYIGKVGIQDEDADQLIVVDWRAPVASMFYSFSGHGDFASYESPDGEISGTVYLKRNIAIRNQQIQRIVNSFVRGTDHLGVTDEFLLYRLGENKDNRLRDIVSTIQHEQDRIIRAHKDQALLIQGVPGSGKTTVALHRLAYLLYQYQDKLKAEKIVIFAPNQMFLDYISDVLPELGVGGVQQTTFASWALDLLQEKVQIQDSNQRQVTWFERDQQTPQEDISISKMKGSLSFLVFLQQAFDQYEKNFIPKKDFVPWDGIVLTAKEIRYWFEVEYKHDPFLKRVERITARIKRWIEIEHSSYRQMDPKGTWKKKANQRLRAYMKTWPLFTTHQLYIHLCSTSPQSSLDQPLYSMIQQSMKQKQLHYEDIAPLLYLHLRLHGVKNSERFDHVVIDEAQDVSPFQIAILKEYCPSQSFTILGDLMQNIFSYQGIEHWNDFSIIFDQDQWDYIQLHQSYRSTMEIINFSNEIIKSYLGELTPAQPVFRSGELIRLIQQENSLDQTLLSSIQYVQQQGSHTIAIITRTEQKATEIHRSLQALGLSIHLITPEQKEYRGGISVIPIYLTKGMEFDAVLLIDIDETNYPEQPLLAKLLYVGCTRALHQLFIFYKGKLSPLLSKIPKSLYVTTLP
ncbi:HelD family protein [Hazenella coriacea]|uniref:DNA 3'-5' helicase n=1 Tax=Hazenella coriacea TaxID=1179467 RepID=A0A4R3L8U8_9BACL|nr:UvrD-helicase domain-containing protein [Hazenella coriacea]TCS93926.1 DNA helicase-2/ATP-dependent DNA helicase PcrA [Hazenella coriacea]